MKRLVLAVLPLIVFYGCGSHVAEQQNPPVNQSKAYLVEGIQHLKDADVADAIKSFDAAIKANPSDPAGYIVLSETFTRMKEYDRAVNSLNVAAHIAPDQGRIYYLLAVNYVLLGKNDLAKENVQKSIDIFRQQKDEKNFVKSLALMQGIVKDETKGQ